MDNSIGENILFRSGQFVAIAWGLFVGVPIWLLVIGQYSRKEFAYILNYATAY